MFNRKKVVPLQDAIAMLIRDLGGIRQEVDIANNELRDRHRRGDIMGLVRLISDHMRLEFNFQVYVVKDLVRKKKDWAAEIMIPRDLFWYRKGRYYPSAIPMYIKSSVLRENPFEATVVVIAHELAHIALTWSGSRFQDDEVSVDLTAMILGYSQFFLNGRRYSVMRTPARGSIMAFIDSVFGTSPNQKRLQWVSLAYLNESDAECAAALIGQKAAHA